MRYEHLFFDLDHTLWDFETNAKETLSELYALNALHEKGVDDFDVFFSRYSYHNQRLWDRYTKGFIKQEELRWKRMWLALLDFKQGDEVLARKMAVEFLERLPLKKALFPYAAELLDYLRKKGYAMHLVTNGFDAVQHSKIQSSSLQHYFTEVITSERSNSLKPHPDIFNFAMNACGTTADKCIMIGDNLVADIQGAKDAGIDTIFVNHLNVHTTVESTYTVYHLQDIERIL